MAETKKNTQKSSTMTKKNNGKKKTKSMLERQIGTTAGATQRRFAVAQNTAPFVNNAVIQIDKCLQIVNRRLYRQHKVYRARVEIDSAALSGAPGKRVQLFALKNSWANRKAFALAKEMYDKAVSEERAEVGNARWHDFRMGIRDIWPSSTAAVFPVTTRQDGNREVIDIGNGEYGNSEVVTTTSAGNTQTKGFILGPTSYFDDYSVFLEFANMGPRVPTDPGAVSPGGYDRATGTSFEDGNVEDLLDNGNYPPYDVSANQSVLSGGPLVKVGDLFHNPNGASVLRTDYFDAPLGIIIAVGYGTGIDVPEAVEDIENLLTITVKDGDYKGVAAEDI